VTGKRHAPAALANREALLTALRRLLPARGTVLELGSGTGEHAVWLARHLPALAFQPSDPDEAARASIVAWSEEAGLPNLRSPLNLDLTLSTWWGQKADAVLCVNVLHLLPPTALDALAGGAARVLPPEGVLCACGPFRQVGAPAPARLEDLDRRLRAKSPALGVPAAEALERAGRLAGLAPAGRVEMGEGDLLVALRPA
jgi:SAM-dependent methyltransferase